MNEKILRIKEFDIDCINPRYNDRKKPEQGGSKIVVIGKPGCFAKDTKMLLYNGTSKKVQDITTDDVLMGDDSRPRKVLELCRNIDSMYKIIPKIGKTVIVNKEHILSLISTKGSDKGAYIDITLSKYLQLPEKIRSKYHWFRTSIEYPEKSVYIDPYIYGFFLDGDFNFIKKQFIKTQFNIKDNVIDNLIDKYNDGIQNNFIINNREKRLQLLAGILDGFSSYNNITKRFTIEAPNEKIAKQLIQLSNSLGFYSSKIKNVKPDLLKKSVTKVYTCYIYANTNNIIPSKIYKINYAKVLFNDLFTTEFKVEYDGEYQYYGFTVDDNHRFLLKDCSVVHNTGKCLAKNTPIITEDGNIKMVQDIEVGDKLIGDDSKIRNVLSTCSGQEEMYTIEQTFGDSYTVNKSHILSLVDDNNNVRDINVEEYYNSDLQLYGYNKLIEFDKKQVDIPEYIMGYFIGNIYNKLNNLIIDDINILNKLMYEFSKINCFISHNDYGRYYINNNFNIDTKNIMKYLTTHSKFRFRLLAGILDSNTSFKYNDKGCSFQVNNIYDNDIKYLCRSLGINITKYNDRFYLSGDLTKIPICRNNIKLGNYPEKNYIKITKSFFDTYYGFEIDGNKRFLLGDFTVTHNTTLIKSLLFQKRDIFPMGVVCNGTEDSNHAWSGVFPPSFIYNYANLDKIQDFVTRQKYAKQHLENPWGVLLMDDCNMDKKIFNDPIFRGIFMNGRHYKMLFILASQHAMDLKPELRTCIDYTFIFRDPNLKNRKALWENYASIIHDFDTFCKIMDSVTGNYTALVINNTVQSNNIEDCVFYFKPRIPPKDFKFGSVDFWNHHYARYNEKYTDNLF